MVRAFPVFILTVACALSSSNAAASASDIVLYASEAPVIHGNWAVQARQDAAGGRAIASADLGWSAANAPLPEPANFFELTFVAPAATTYRVWLRLRAAGDSKWNDSVWAQFSDSTLPNGAAAYRIGSTSALMVNLERCNGCGTSAWGWHNGAYWLTQPTEIQFATSGAHTIRIQTREDGVELDQIVLSPATFRSSAPGAVIDDTTILPPQPVPSNATEIVLYASEAARVQGNWTAASRTGAAGGRSMTSADAGWSTLNSPLGAPADYFELTFDAPAATTYRLWLRLRATADSKWNDAVWVQFSDATLPTGESIYRVGTTSALLVNLERCNGCGTSGWGWQNTAYWLAQATEIRFANSGAHTIRVQIREDGVEVDQIVLSAEKFRAAAPGPLVNDSTILAKTTSTASESDPAQAPGGSSSPYKGTPFALPGTVDAANFDNGGQHVAYYDTTAGNTGGAYRATDVDLQAATGGGYNVGWTAAGEWLKYTVSVGSAASYTVHLRVAATAAQTLQIAIGGATAKVAVPNTGGWQAWQTVSVPMTLSAGQQVMTVTWTTGGVNLRSITVSAVATAGDAPPPGSGVGGTFRMLTWNVHHGKNTSNVLSVPAQAKFIAAQNPHVVVLQEVQTWDQNQPLLFETELEKLTGVNWTRQWAPVVESAWTEGNLVLTRLDVISSRYFQMHATSDWTVLLANRSVAQATVLVGGVAVDVFSTHLDYGNTTYRTTQLHQMMDWVRTFGKKRIVGGDFNSSPGTYWINTMLTEYRDTWQEVTGSSSGGGTINGVRFDYLFFARDAGSTIKPTSVKVLSTTLSDHLPVVADYTITP